VKAETQERSSLVSSRRTKPSSASDPVRWLAIGWLAVAGCVARYQPEILSVEDQPMVPETKSPAARTELATLGAGCFWCVEAIYQQLDGVLSVESGYAGGHVVNPTYEQVCEKTTGHAEVCQIRFDPDKISYDELLEVFWKTHDPTTPNRQGADVGPQYRSVIFYHSERQRDLAERYKRELNEKRVFDAPIVTEISPITQFYRAEGYHQNYYRSNPYQGYCRLVIQPKVDKFRQVFKAKLKPAE
jgi:peptide-methionine (S)-S-oxide reductase